MDAHRLAVWSSTSKSVDHIDIVHLQASIMTPLGCVLGNANRHSPTHTLLLYNQIHHRHNSMSLHTLTLHDILSSSLDNSRSRSSICHTVNQHTSSPLVLVECASIYRQEVSLRIRSNQQQQLEDNQSVVWLVNRFTSLFSIESISPWICLILLIMFTYICSSLIALLSSEMVSVFTCCVFTCVNECVRFVCEGVCKCIGAYVFDWNSWWSS